MATVTNSMKQNKRDLTQGPITGHIIRLSLPMVIGLFAVISLGVVDTIWVSMLGTHELAAMGFIFPVLNFFSFVTLGLAMGVTSAVARAIGEKNHEKVVRLTTDSLILSIFIVALFALVGIFTINPLFKLMGAPPEILPLIREYMVVWYCGITCLVVPMIGNAAVRANGDTRRPAMVLVLSALSNVALAPLFIFGWGPIPAMGLHGAALGVVVSQVVSLVAGLYFVAVKYKMVSFKKESLALRIQSWRAVLAVGLPAALANAIVPIGMGVITSLVADHGKIAVASFGVVSKVTAVFQVALIGLSSAMGPFVGQNFGAKAYSRIDEAMGKIIKISFIWGLMISITLLILGKSIIGIFDKSGELTHIGYLYFWIIPWTLAFEGIRQVIATSFNAMGKGIVSTLLILIRMVILFIPLAYILPHYLDLPGIFWAEGCSNLIAGILAIIYYKSQIKKLS